MHLNSITMCMIQPVEFNKWIFDVLSPLGREAQLFLNRVLSLTLVIAAPPW